MIEILIISKNQESFEVPTYKTFKAKNFVSFSVIEHVHQD